MFAHFAQETGNHNPSDKEYEEWRQVRDNDEDIDNVKNVDDVDNVDNVDNVGSVERQGVRGGETGSRRYNK